MNSIGTEELYIIVTRSPASHHKGAQERVYDFIANDILVVFLQNLKNSLVDNASLETMI